MTTPIQLPAALPVEGLLLTQAEGTETLAVESGETDGGTLTGNVHLTATATAGGVSLSWRGTADALERSDDGGEYTSLGAGPFVSPTTDATAQGVVQYRALIGGAWVYSDSIYVPTTYDLAPYIRDDVIVEVSTLPLSLTPHAPVVTAVVAPREYDIAPYIGDVTLVQVPLLTLALNAHIPTVTAQRNATVSAPVIQLALTPHVPNVTAYGQGAVIYDLAPYIEERRSNQPLFMGAGF